MPTAIEDRGIWGAGGYEILDIERFIPRPAGGSYFYVTMRHTVTGTVYKGQMYNTVDMMVKAITECEYEFGPHEDHTDCARILDGMSEGYSDPYAHEDDPSRLTSSNYGFPVFEG